jgi:5-methyltetrahydropteroyltriglutamate--homocysteine methyltransferase
MATEYHAEHVGSLLRPPWLLEAREAHENGTLPAQELREFEDRAILELLDLQKEAGLRVFTDGEARRESWRAGLMESLNGVVPAPRTMRWYRNGKELSAQETLSDGVAAVSTVSRKGDLSSREARFMAAHAPGAFKITMISASMGGMIWHPTLSAQAYPALGDLTEDLVALQIEEVESLIDQGVRWIQLDSLSYNQVIDPGQSGSTRGSPGAGAVLDAAIAVDSRIVTAIKRKNSDVTVGMHICRGNYRSSWLAQGSYEPVAERLFNEVPVDRFLLEYDTQRAGGFEPLRFVPRGERAPTVVLGLVTTKVAELEDQDELCRRVDQAAKFVPLENLAISPQCGFASGSLGNLITVDDERRKLELVASTAGKVWG